MLLCRVGARLVAGDAVTVPVGFQGIWGTSLANCGSDDSDSVMEIGPRQVSFWESGGPVLTMHQEGDSDVILTLDLSVEDERWTDTVHFRLSADGKTLSKVEDDGTVAQYLRCR